MENILRPVAEQRYAAELSALEKWDADNPKPMGWKLSPNEVQDSLISVLNDKVLNIPELGDGGLLFTDQHLPKLHKTDGSDATRTSETPSCFPALSWTEWAVAIPPEPWPSTSGSCPLPTSSAA